MTRVIKVGGRTQSNPALFAALASAHRDAPGTLVVVHGGGDEINALQRLHGAVPRFHGGRRITSALDLEIVRMALSGSANKRMVSALVGEGVAAVGMSGEDAGLLMAAPLGFEEYGYVGAPTHVRAGLLTHLLDGGYLPVVSPVARNETAEHGAILNVNGDDAAAAIAVALGASELLLVSDVEGVLVESNLRRVLDTDEATRLVDSGIAAAGMRAKLEAGLLALERGVERVRISDIAAISDDDRGTMLTRVGSVYA